VREVKKSKPVKEKKVKRKSGGRIALVQSPDVRQIIVPVQIIIY